MLRVRAGFDHLKKIFDFEVFNHEKPILYLFRFYFISLR